MEHRDNSRESRQINVRLYKDNDFIAAARTKNIDQNGMFIKTDVLLFPKNSHIEVVFDVESNKGKVEQCRVPATVVHRSLSGMGIKFGQCKNVCLRAIAHANAEDVKLAG